MLQNSQNCLELPNIVYTLTFLENTQLNSLNAARIEDIKT